MASTPSPAGPKTSVGGNPVFIKGFLPGLVIGLLVGLAIGAFVPPLLNQPEITPPANGGNGARHSGDRTRDDMPPTEPAPAGQPADEGEEPMPPDTVDG